MPPLCNCINIIHRFPINILYITISHSKYSIKIIHDLIYHNFRHLYNFKSFSVPCGVHAGNTPDMHDTTGALCRLFHPASFCGRTTDGGRAYGAVLGSLTMECADENRRPHMGWSSTMYICQCYFLPFISKTVKSSSSSSASNGAISKSDPRVVISPYFLDFDRRLRILHALNTK